MSERRAYARAVLGGRDAVLDGILRRSLLEARMPTIQIDDDTGRVLQLITSLHRPRRAIEIGSLFGYSSIYMARGLPAGAMLTTLESNPTAAALTRENLEIAGVSDKAEVVCEDALDYIGRLAPQSVDMVFIDGSKNQYPQYLKHVHPAIRSGGLIIADDVFGDGDYSNESAGDGSHESDRAAIDSYVRALGRSRAFTSTFIYNGNGLLVSIKE